MIEMKKWLCLSFIIISAGFRLLAQDPVKPNVIFILTDQWRACAFGYTGNNVVQTPHIDQFARAGISFKNAVSVLPVCTPYRASLMTGRYPTSTGIFINDLYLPSEELCMAEIFNEANYNTAYLGKWHIDGHGRMNCVAPERRQGWMFWKGSECDHNYPKEHYYDNSDTSMLFWEGYSTYAIADEAQKYMQEHASDKEPFCLFVSIATPHFPHNTAPEEYKKLYTADKLKLRPNVPDELKADALKELQGYYAHCTATDKAIGEIIDKAKSLGIYDNSIIVFTSDHGEMMGSHNIRPWRKFSAYTESSSIPFLISYPGIGEHAGDVAEAALTTPDILPSILSLCNIDIPETIEGYDLSKIMKSPSSDPERAALFMNLAPFGVMYEMDEYRAVRTASYTYVKTPAGPSMLFDNRKDPYQMNNLVNEEAFSEIKAKLDRKLLQELERIGETSIETRDHYLKKFGYFGKKEFRKDYHIKNVGDVKVVISPNDSFTIK
jgi:arylsulfatase A-like enzyme